MSKMRVVTVELVAFDDEDALIIEQMDPRDVLDIGRIVDDYMEEVDDE